MFREDYLINNQDILINITEEELSYILQTLHNKDYNEYLEKYGYKDFEMSSVNIICFELEITCELLDKLECIGREPHELLHRYIQSKKIGDENSVQSFQYLETGVSLVSLDRFLIEDMIGDDVFNFIVYVLVYKINQKYYHYLTYDSIITTEEEMFMALSRFGDDSFEESI